MGTNMVRKRTFYIITIISLFAITMIAPSVLGAKRSELLVDFVLDCQDEQNKAFGDNPSNNENPSAIATMASVYILNTLEEYDNLDSNTKTSLLSWILDELDIAILSEDLITISYLLEAIDVIGTPSDELSESEIDDLKNLLLKLKDTHGESIGYGISEDDNTTLFGTYFAVKCYSHLDLILNEGDPLYDIGVNIINYVDSCYNETVGGYKTNTSDDYTTISLINTYYATNIVDMLGLRSSIAEIVDNISIYIESFYVDNINMKSHYGGYSLYPEDEVPFSTFLASYYALQSLKAIKPATLPSDATIEWILNHQNPEDGGFIENNELSGDIISSALTSYYAVKIFSLGGDNMVRNNLYKEAWGFDILWPLIILVVILIIALVIAGIVYYRNKTAL
jgi:prenyltransferase beta subunit